MIERFTRDRFEKALPAVGGQALWSPLGLVAGEFCYIIPVKPGVLIYVRSSVDPTGVAAETAKDSIRCWLASNSDGDGLGSKDQRWIARTPGWDQRLIETLRKLWTLGKRAKKCKICGQQMRIIKSKKENENEGRWYSKCFTCNKFGDWLTDPEKEAA